MGVLHTHTHTRTDTPSRTRPPRGLHKTLHAWACSTTVADHTFPVAIPHPTGTATVPVDDALASPLSTPSHTHASHLDTTPVLLQLRASVAAGAPPMSEAQMDDHSIRALRAAAAAAASGDARPGGSGDVGGVGAVPTRLAPRRLVYVKPDDPLLLVVQQLVGNKCSMAPMLTCDPGSRDEVGGTARRCCSGPSCGAQDGCMVCGGQRGKGEGDGACNSQLTYGVKSRVDANHCAASRRPSDPLQTVRVGLPVKMTMTSAFPWVQTPSSMFDWDFSAFDPYVTWLKRGVAENVCRGRGEGQRRTPRA
eukprot:351375-Chlamydomonas_euryale.AAC.18